MFVSTTTSLRGKIGYKGNVELMKQAGFTAYLCACGDGYIGGVTAALGHQYVAGRCTLCGAEDPDYQPNVTVPTLTLKSPTLEFKDMITVNAFYTAENIQDVVEMGMITYSSKVDTWSVETAEYVIPGASYDTASDRYEINILRGTAQQKVAHIASDHVTFAAKSVGGLPYQMERRGIYPAEEEILVGLSCFHMQDCQAVILTRLYLRGRWSRSVRPEE